MHRPAAGLTFGAFRHAALCSGITKGFVMVHRQHLIALAVCSLFAPAVAPVLAQDSGQRIEITGSLIKRTDRETPSPVVTLTRQDIQQSGYGSVEEQMRTLGIIDAGLVDDSKSSGFVSGVSTNSLRGFGSQSTLTLINGRRVAPVASVDINFGRGTLVSVNTIPKGAIEKIEILKDGASALYGSDALVGVINYVLRKEYKGAEVTASLSSNDKGVGHTRQINSTFGFGDLSTQRFNVFGGIDVFQRDRVATGDLLDKGSWDLMNNFRALTGGAPRFSYDTVASNPGNYYRLPAAFPATTTAPNGVRTVGNSVFGPLFLGSLPGCADAATVGKGLENRPSFIAATDPSWPTGMCRLKADDYAEWIGKQDRVNGLLRATFQVTPLLNAYADLMVSRTKTTEDDLPSTLTTALVTSANQVATSWPKLDGTFRTQNAIILPVGHPDNPTNGTATAQPVQLLYRFTDLPNQTISDLRSTRLLTGITGVIGDWDIDSALLVSRQDNTSTRTNRLRSSLLNAAITSGSYRFGKPNDAAAIASVSSDAVTEGESTTQSIDLRASREIFSLPGGKAGIAVGLEYRKEKLTSTPSDIYLSGDFIGLVANGASGSRNSTAGFAELALPVLKSLELQAAVRQEKYSDFGNATTGKLGFKWGVLPSTLVLRGTAATGFRAPSISQISNSFLVSFNNSQDRRVFDPIRCDSSNPNAPVSRAAAPVNRDCNVFNFSSVPAGTVTPGNLPTVIAGNPNLKPESSRSATLGLILSPNKDVDFSLDYFYFERKDEIRVQRGIDVFEDYIRAGAGASSVVIRDPNPSTWLPGIPNSGPVLAVTRQYGNFLYSATNGFDYDLSVRLPASDMGRFTLKVDGTRVLRFDRQLLATSPVDRVVGSTVTDVPRNKFNIAMLWARESWNGFVRLSHTDALDRTGVTATCQTSTTASNTYLRDNSWCGVSAQNYYDVGVTYRGVKNLALSATVLNFFDKYGGTQEVPAVHNYYYANTATSLGRRFNLSVEYKFF
jgi:iron complex outermembrane recepter protein